MPSPITIPLGEIVDDITVGYVGPMAHEYVDQGIPFLRSLNVRPFRFDPADIKYISPDFHQKIRKSALNPGDVVVVRTGNPGVACVVPQTLPVANCSDLVVIRPGQNMSPEFLCYYINSITHSHIKGQLVGAIQQHFNIGSAKEIKFPKIGKGDQQRIAAVLSALDAKIELNQRLSAELEGLAKLLYDYWFVQYDFPLSPAQAAALRKPHLTGHPYRSSGGPMVFNEKLKREIPRGWEAGTAKDLFTFNPSISITKGEVAAYLDMDALPTSGFMTKKIQRKEFNGGTKFTNGDVLVARITPCLENGKTGLVTLLEEGEAAFGSTEFIVLRGKNMPLSSYGCCLSRSDYFRKFAVGNMTGTSGRKRLEAPVLEKLPLPIPPPELLTQFENICAPMFQLMTKHTQQSHHLAQLRDWLLPMLMNGQVRAGSPTSE